MTGNLIETKVDRRQTPIEIISDVCRFALTSFDVKLTKASIVPEVALQPPESVEKAFAAMRASKRLSWWQRLSPVSTDDIDLDLADVVRRELAIMVIPWSTQARVERAGGAPFIESVDGSAPMVFFVTRQEHRLLKEFPGFPG